MNKIIHAVYLLLIVILAGCAVNERQIIENQTIDVNQRSELDKFFVGYDCVALETNDSTVVSHVDDFEVGDNLIAIQSRSDIFTFNRNGKSIGVISKKGNASNEYLEIGDFKLSDGLVWVLSPMQKKITVYDQKGNFIRKIDLDNIYYAFEFVDDSRIFLASENCNDTGYNFALVDLKDGNVISRFDNFKKNEGVVLNKVYCPFIGRTDENDIIVCHPFETSVYTLSSEGFDRLTCFSFNTDFQLNGQYGETPFIDLLNESQNQSVVTNISNYYRNSNYELIAFPLFGEYGMLYNLVKIKDGRQSAFSPILEKIDPRYPYISAPLKIYSGEVVSCMPAGRILYIEDNNNLTKFKKQGLNNADNPVVFFHKLKSE